MAVDNFPKGTYEARVVEHPGRRTFTGIDPQTGEPTGETKVYDVTLNEGTVTQQGTAWTPSVMNDLENRIGNSVGQIKNEFTATQYKNDSSLTTDAQTVVGGINEANAKAMNIADVFSTSSIYAVGAYCLYQNVLYKCTVAVTTAGEWDENKWTQVKVANELGSGGGATTFADLTDTNFTNLQNGQIAKYNSSTQKWENADETGGSAEFQKTASGAVVSFNDGADDLPVVDLTAQITAVQSGSGDPSPSNVRPISGFTGVNVKRVGINIWDEQWEVGGINTTTGQDNSVTDRIRSVGYIPVKPTSQYFCYNGVDVASSSNVNTVILCYDINKQYTGTYYYKAKTQPILTVPSDCYFVRFYTGPGYGSTYLNDISINYPSTDTSYHAYNGTTYSVSWQTEAGEIFDGTINFVFGLLTATHAKRTFDGTENTWNTGTSSYDFQIEITDMKSADFQSGLCNWLKVMTSGSETAPCVRIGANTRLLYFYNIKSNIPSVTDLASWKTYLSTHNLDVVYPLATPQTYQLTPTEINTLLGVNNIFADTGDVNVTYATEAVGDIAEVLINDGRTANNTTWSSTKINTQLNSKQNALTAGTGIDITSDTISVTDYIKDVSVADEYDATATYAVGDYCIHGGLLYICTTAISTAEDWDATHWTQTNVMSQMPTIPWTDVTGTLSASSTSITLSDASITTSSTIDVYTDPPEIPHNTMAVTTGSVTLTFDAQQSATIVKVRIS